VTSRSTSALRIVAVALIVMFGLSTTHAGNLHPHCAGYCAPDCPMHANGLGCHHGSDAGATHCHQRADQFAGLRSNGCRHQSEDSAVRDQPAALPVPRMVVAAPSIEEGPVAAAPTPLDRTGDPPFHPPRIASFTI
jgi:hypothetical protein